MVSDGSVSRLVDRDTMNAGIKQFEPGKDIGVELSEEWGMAERLGRGGGRLLRGTPGSWSWMPRLYRRPPMASWHEGGRRAMFIWVAAGRWMLRRPGRRPGGIGHRVFGL